jgi:Relaxase/Mobilisation nuclease domain
MIVRIFSTGKSKGEGINYLLSNKDHTGAIRKILPRVLEGNKNTTIQIINSISRDWKYVSGVIAFRDNEKPTQEQMLKVIDKFKQTFLAGLSANQFNALFVLHRDKNNDEIHFVVPMTELSTGKRLNIHPVGQKNLDLYQTFSKVLNQELGFAQIVPDDLKIALPSHKLKSPEFKDDKRKNILLEKEVKKAIVSGKVENRTQLCKFLDEELGVSIHRQGKDYISIRLPGDQKSRRLRGPMFEENANYSDMLETSRKCKVPVKLTDTQYQEQKTKLNELINERAAFNALAYSKTKPVRLGGEARTTKIIQPAMPKTTITKETTPMANNTVIKKMIRDALMRVLLGTPTKKPVHQVPNIKEVLNRKNEAREKAYPTTRNNPPVSNGAIYSLMRTIDQVKLSIHEAITDIANAKSPKERIIAEQRLKQLQELERQLGMQLHEAKLNIGNHQNSFKLKL